ncbi:DoxX family protein [Sphingobium sp. MK2]|uniref:DoxX family protein n=1 Tax=Sphingobium sp. MK2 TaxID=3116540 RepID=UPI0032E36301
MNGHSGGRGLNIALWVAQALVGLPFTLFGFMKLTSPIAELAKTVPWVADYSEAFVRMMGVVDMAGGLGMLLPAITRIKPQLTIYAAMGCMALQICAMIFHVLRGEAMVTPLNLVFFALAAFTFWGRRSRAPITPRG